MIWRRRAVVAGLAAVAGQAFAPALGRSQETSVIRNEIEFRFLQDSAVVFEAALAGRSVTALLDSGAATTLVSARLAAALGWPIGLGQTLRGNAREAAAGRGLPVLLQIGGYRLDVPASAIVDLDLISSSIGVSIDVVLGKHLLDSTVVSLDFPARHLALGDALWETRGDGATVALGRGPHGERLLPVSIEGRPAVSAVFDLGSSSPLMLSAAYAGPAGLLVGKRTSTAAIGGVEGIEISTAAVMDRLEVAGFTVRRLPTDVLPRWLEPEIPANLGLPVLSRFRLVCDFARDRVHLGQDDSALSKAFDKDRTGLGIAFGKDRLTVVHVAAASPAAVAGLKLGDEITGIDGQPIGPTYVQGDQWRWRWAQPGRSWTLSLANGAEVTLTLADYY